ncbi:hypothetical protein J2TS4_42750 [Paenibacillus sp. J2TS4]|nr:hypothetical protein J2TS4_42750 [Paenibacillus sp. J2TS4]
MTQDLPVHLNPETETRPTKVGKNQKRFPLVSQIKVFLNKQLEIARGSTAKAEMVGSKGGGGDVGTGPGCPTGPVGGGMNDNCFHSFSKVG